MKIAVRLNDGQNVIDANVTNEFGALLQVKLFDYKGWTLVESDPTFSISNMYLWTIRKSDNKLVHINTMMTPDEENNAVSAATLKQVGAVSAQVNSLATAFGAYMKATASSDANTTNTEEGTE